MLEGVTQLTPEAKSAAIFSTDELDLFRIIHLPQRLPSHEGSPF